MSEQHLIFGTGAVGMAVMEELVRRGKPVKMVNRSGRAGVLAGVEVLAGDVTQGHTAIHLAEGATHIYNCTNPPYHRWLAEFPFLQASVLGAAIASGAKFIAMDNLYMYGSTAGKPLTEESPYNAHTRKGKLRAQMARDLMDAHESGKVRVVIARASDYFGARGLGTAMGDRVFKNAIQGKAAQVIGNPDQPHDYTYIPDIGKALVILGEHDAALGQVWHIPNPPTMTTRAFIEKIYAALGSPPQVSVAPKPLMRLLGVFNADLRELLEMYYEFEEPFVVDSSKFERAFGNIATPLEAALATTIEWFKNAD